MKEDKDTRVVEVFRFALEAEFIKVARQWNRIYPERRRWARSFTAPYYIGQEIAVLVNEDDYENAMEIVRNREKANE